MATEVAQAYVQIMPSAQGIQSQLQSVLGAPLEQMGTTGGAAFGANLMGALSGAGIAAAAAAAGQKIGQVISDSIQTGMDFDKSMSQVAATMGTTVDQIADLRGFAMEMGATTAFSANQAADALNYMALAGYDAETAMGMLPTVLNLAAAGGMDLARASDMITDSQSALGLSLEDTGRMVDQMAMAASKSNTSVEQLGDAILTVGGTAKFMSEESDGLATVLGLMADNGIKGAEAGTHLRNMILSLSAPTDKAKAQLESLGVQVFDTEGNMRAFADIFPDLNAALDSLTGDQRAEALSTIFNSRDMAAAQALLSTSIDRWNELGAAIDDSAGAAQRMADTQLDNLAGDITLMESAAEGAKIAISDLFTPLERAGTQLKTAFLGGFTDFVTEIGDTLGKIGDMLNGSSDGIETAVSTVSENIAHMGEVNNILSLIDQFQELRDEMQQDGISAEDLAGKQAELDEVRRQLSDATDGVITKEGEYNEELDNTIEKLETILGLSLYEDLADSYASLLSGQEDYLDKLNQEKILQAQLDEATQRHTDAAINLMGKDEAAAEMALAAWEKVKESQEKGLFDTSTQEGVDNLNTALEELSKTASSLSTSEITFGDLASAEDYFDNLNLDMDDLTAATSAWSEEQKGLETQLDSTTEAIDAYEQAVMDWVTAGGDAEDGAELLGISVEELNERMDTGETTAEDFADGMTAVATASEEAAQAAKEAHEGIIGIASAAIDARYSGGDLREEYEKLSAELEKLRDEGTETDIALAEQKLHLLNLAATNQELAEGYPTLTARLSDFGISLTQTSGWLIDNGITAEEWGSSVTGALSSVVSSFNEMDTDLDMSLETMAANLQKNITATTQWNENMRALWTAAASYAGEGGQEAATAFVSYMQQMGPAAAAQVAQMVTNVDGTLATFAPMFATAADQAMIEVYNGIQGTDLAGAVSTAAEGFPVGIEAQSGPTAAAAQQVAYNAALGAAGSADNFQTVGGSFMNRMASGITGGSGTVSGAALSVAMNAYSVAGSVPFYSVGYNIAQGIARGISGGSSAISSAAQAAVNNALAAAKSAAGIASPSRVFRDQVGGMIAAGVAVGISDGEREVSGSMRELVQAMTFGDQRFGTLRGSLYGGREQPGDQVQVTMNVYGAQGQSEERLAELVEQRLYRSYRSRKTGM